MEAKKEPKARKPRTKSGTKSGTKSSTKRKDKPVSSLPTVDHKTRHVYTVNYYVDHVFQQGDFHTIALWERVLRHQNAPGAFFVVLSEDDLLYKPLTDEVTDGINNFNEKQITLFTQYCSDKLEWLTVEGLNPKRSTKTLDMMLSSTEWDHLSHYNPLSEYCIFFLSIGATSIFNLVKCNRTITNDFSHREFMLRHIHTCQCCFPMKNHEAFKTFLKSPVEDRNRFRSTLRSCPQCLVFFWCPSTDRAHQEAKRQHVELCDSVRRGVVAIHPHGTSLSTINLDVRLSMEGYVTEVLTAEKDPDNGNPLTDPTITPRLLKDFRFVEFFCMYEKEADRMQFLSKYTWEQMDQDELLKRLERAGFSTNFDQESLKKKRKPKTEKKEEKKESKTKKESKKEPKRKHKSADPTTMDVETDIQADIQASIEALT